jgi:ribosomal-protein-alanine N-acetyltransferase
MPHQTPQTAIRFRAMTEADLAAVGANEAACHDDPWTAELLQSSLAQGHRCRLLVENSQIRGHGILQVSGEEAEILNICVIPAAQGGGRGRALLRHLLDLAREGGAQEVFLEVRASNDRALGLYESEGFHQVGRRPNYYPRGEDGLIMARYLTDPFGAL